MFFLLKAAFWLGLVFFLLPPAGPLPHASQRPQTAAGHSAPTDATSIAAEAASRVIQYCRDNAQTCATGAALATEASAAVQRQLTHTPQPAAAPPAAPAARAQDTLTPADLQVPFGGILPAAGSAPRTAPLPPRRPA
jgi:hypothetical protein